MNVAIELDPIRGSLPRNSEVPTITTSTAFPDPSEHMKCMSKAPLTEEELCTLKELMNTKEEDSTSPGNFLMPSADFLLSSPSSQMQRSPNAHDPAHPSYDLLQEISSPTSSAFTGNNAPCVDDVWSFKPFGMEHVNSVASNNSLPPNYEVLSAQPGGGENLLFGNYISHIISEDNSSQGRICTKENEKKEAISAQKNRLVRKKQEKLESAATDYIKPDVHRKDLKKAKKPCPAELRAIRARRNRESARRSREKAKMEYQRMLDTYNRLKTENELLRRLAEKLSLEFGSNCGPKEEVAERTSQSSVRQGCH